MERAKRSTLHDLITGALAVTIFLLLLFLLYETVISIRG